MSRFEVFLIVDPEFGGDLWRISRRSHVWIMNSPHNDDLVNRVWARESGEASSPAGISTFPSHENPLALVFAYLETIDDHHGGCAGSPRWSVIHVRGVPLADVSRRRVEEALGASVEIRREAGGFAIVRENGG